MNNQILIIALILMALWIYYHQNNNSPVLSENQTQIANLQQEVHHYQTLYQKRVAKDITADQSAKIIQLTQTIQDLESNLAGANQAKGLYSQKIGDLEQQLFSLAHQKIKNQKEAQTLLNQLEKNWDQAKEIQITSLTNERDNLKNDNEKIKQQTIKDKKEINKLKHDIQIAVLKKQQLENNKTQLTTQKLELENQVNNLEIQIKDRDKTIKSLELKNEKLTNNYKKLIQFLADARLLVSHLQKDLATENEETYKLEKEISLLKLEQDQDQEYIDRLKKRIDDTHPNKVETHLLSLTVWKDWKPDNYKIVKGDLESLPRTQLRKEYLAVRDKLLELINSLLKEEELKKQLKQDKAHIQKELNDALAILNKPTAEIGTQTDLTAEQISKMEEDLETKRTELTKLAQDQKEQEYQKKLQEISNLQTKYDTEVRTKKELLKYLNTYREQGFFGWNNRFGVSLKEFADQHLPLGRGVELVSIGYQNRDSEAFIFDYKDIERIVSPYFCLLKVKMVPKRSVIGKTYPSIILTNMPKKYKKVSKLVYEKDEIWQVSISCNAEII